MLTKDTELLVRETVADGSHQLEGHQLRAPGETEPQLEALLAMLVVLCCLPSLSALCPETLAPEGRPPWVPLRSVFWLGLGHGKYQQECGGRR